jgi:hypothetical protein
MATVLEDTPAVVVPRQVTPQRGFAVLQDATGPLDQEPTVTPPAPPTTPAALFFV